MNRFIILLFAFTPIQFYAAGIEDILDPEEQIGWSEKDEYEFQRREKLAQEKAKNQCHMMSQEKEKLIKQNKQCEQSLIGSQKRVQQLEKKLEEKKQSYQVPPQYEGRGSFYKAEQAEVQKLRDAIESLESDVDVLSFQKKDLQQQNTKLSTENKELSRELEKQNNFFNQIIQKLPEKKQ